MQIIITRTGVSWHLCCTSVWGGAAGVIDHGHFIFCLCLAACGLRVGRTDSAVFRRQAFGISEATSQ